MLRRQLNNNSNLELVISNSIEEVENYWEAYGIEKRYFKKDYVHLLESFGPLNYNYTYAIILKNSLPVGLIYCQRKKIELHKDFRIHTHSNKILERLRVAFLKILFRRVKHEILICGNVLLTGEYGFNYREEEVSAEDITESFRHIVAYYKSELGVKLKTILIKDFYKNPSFANHQFRHPYFYTFEVQPDMVIPVNQAWSTYEDYLTEVKSKYRVKFKKVKKKGKALEYRELDEDLCKRYNDDMYELYLSTAKRASFSLFILDPNYFFNLKKTLKQDLKLTGVFLEDKLVAFFSYVRDGEIGDAHFLGYDVKLNSQYQIYFNILLKLLEQAITGGVKYLNLSRTALEIKSSVGAIPYEMEVHLAHTNKWINKLVPFILKRTVPPNDWVPRSPFK